MGLFYRWERKILLLKSSKLRMISDRFYGGVKGIWTCLSMKLFIHSFLHFSEGGIKGDAETCKRSGETGIS